MELEWVCLRVTAWVGVVCLQGVGESCSRGHKYSNERVLHCTALHCASTHRMRGSALITSISLTEGGTPVERGRGREERRGKERERRELR